MAAPEQPGTYSFRSAEAADASRVAELVDAAYDDYAEVIRNAQVTVAEHHGAIVGSSSSPSPTKGSWSTTSRSIPPIAGPGWDEPS